MTPRTLAMKRVFKGWIVIPSYVAFKTLSDVLSIMADRRLMYNSGCNFAFKGNGGAGLCVL